MVSYISDAEISKIKTFISNLENMNRNQVIEISVGTTMVRFTAPYSVA